MMNKFTIYKDYETGERLVTQELDQLIQFGNEIIYDSVESVLAYARQHLKDGLIDMFLDNLGCTNWTEKELYEEIKETWGNRIG